MAKTKRLKYNAFSKHYLGRSTKKNFYFHFFASAGVFKSVFLNCKLFNICVLTDFFGTSRNWLLEIPVGKVRKIFYFLHYVYEISMLYLCVISKLNCLPESSLIGLWLRKLYIFLREFPFRTPGSWDILPPWKLKDKYLKKMDFCWLL